MLRKQPVPRILKLLSIALITIAVSNCSNADDKKAAGDSARYQQMRQTMVQKQIEARGITDRKVLDAMRLVERHLFVPESERYQAYYDYPLPIGENQTISQPYIVALMTELLDLDGHRGLGHHRGRATREPRGTVAEARSTRLRMRPPRAARHAPPCDRGYGSARRDRGSAPAS